MSSRKIVIVGAGNVAFHLTRALLENTLNVVQIFNRTLEKAQDLANNYNIKYTDKISEIEKADIYIICTSDKAIPEISYYIPFEDCLVVHTSGATPITALKGKYRKGVFYPLQTFSKNKNIKYDEIPFLVEAENINDQNELISLGKRVSEEVYVMPYEKRLPVHMSAVWASNFTNHLYYIAGEICKKQGIPFNILVPLIKETVDKIQNNMSPFEAQTGPAKRQDEEIINKHLQILESDPNSTRYQIYKLITESIIKTYHD